MKYERNSGRTKPITKKPESGKQKKVMGNLHNFTRPPRYTTEQFLKAVKGSGGVKSDIAKRLNKKKRK